MAFPTGWGRRCAVVIQSSKVTSNLTDFPVLLTLATLPSEMFDADGSYPALNGGGDIRFSSDTGGATQLACEVVSFVTDNTPANGSAQIWVKVPSVSSSTDTTIYIWYNKSGETQPAVDASFGAESVWNSSFKNVQHLDEAVNNNSGGYVDSTSNDNDATGVSMSLTAPTVKVGKGQDFDGTADYIKMPVTSPASGDWSLSGWYRLDATSNWVFAFYDYSSSPGYVHFGARMATGSKLGLNASSDDSSWNELNDIVATPALSANTPYHFTVTYNSSTDVITYYHNGSAQTLSDNTITSWKAWDATNDRLACANVYNSGSLAQPLNGQWDEFRNLNTVLTSAWVYAEYSNQNDPGTFVVEGTPETPSSGSTFIPKVMMF